MQGKAKYHSIIRRYQVQLTKYMDLFQTERAERKRLQAILKETYPSPCQSLRKNKQESTKLQTTSILSRKTLDDRSFCSVENQRTRQKKGSVRKVERCQQCPILQGQINDLNQQVRELQTYKNQLKQLIDVKELLKRQVRELNFTIKTLKQENFRLKEASVKQEALKDCSFKLLQEIMSKKLSSKGIQYSVLLSKLMSLPPEKEAVLQRRAQRSRSFFGR